MSWIKRRRKRVNAHKRRLKEAIARALSNTALMHYVKMGKLTATKISADDLQARSLAHENEELDCLCKLKAVAEAAQEFYNAIYNKKNTYETWPDIMESQEVCEARNRLCKALAALEEERDGR